MGEMMGRVMFAAPASGSGKTTVVCGILQALSDRGYHCASLKCGPDYIDPLYHRMTGAAYGGNLDSFFVGETVIRQQLWNAESEADFTILEGVMGYYDGVAGVSLQASSYDIARITQTPVILILDGKGSALSLAAMVKGFAEYRMDSRICGVLWNRTTPLMAERFSPFLEEMGIRVVGALPECEAIRFPSRHLGLLLPHEQKQLRTQMQILGAQVARGVDLDLILEIARSAPELSMPDLRRNQPNPSAQSVRIAVAQDEAFCFYYQENLRLLEALGAQLVSFSPIHDSKLPEGIAGMLLGGGYPEVYASALSVNTSMRESIGRSIGDGMPFLAECGGFLYLHEQLEDEMGTAYAMVGA
ncbi:MAG: cobyrinate a,c-diamide synthase, partial [Hungatella sp.]